MYSYVIDLCANMYAMYLSLLLSCKTDTFRLYFIFLQLIGRPVSRIPL